MLRIVCESGKRVPIGDGKTLVVVAADRDVAIVLIGKEPERVEPDTIETVWGVLPCR